MLWGWLLFKGATIAYNAVFQEDYFSRGGGGGGLLNKGGVCLRKYGNSKNTKGKVTVKLCFK